MKNSTKNSFLRQEFFDKKFIPFAGFDEKFYYALSTDAAIVNRDEAEGNDLYTQLVAYTVIVNPDSKKIFIAKRIGGEKRLLNSYCLGFGGHVNICDSIHNDDMIRHAAIRELTEEVQFYKQDVFSLMPMVGFVRDMESPTREHLGAVYLVIAGKATTKEISNLDGFWVSYEDLKNRYYERLESWSRYILDYIYEDPVWAEKLKF